MESTEVLEVEQPDIIYHACVFRPYNDIIKLVEFWKTKCKQLCVAQHNADGNTKRTHCHFAIVAPTDKMDTMKKHVRDHGGVKGVGQYWITDRVMNGEFKGLIYELPILLKYITKGNAFNVKFQHNITNEQVELAKSEWVTRTSEHSERREDIVRTEKKITIPYQQQIISLAAPEWYKYKKERDDDETADRWLITDSTNHIRVLDPQAKHALITIVCKAMREVSRGINRYLVEDLCRAIIFDDLDFRDWALSKLKSKIDI